MRGLAVELDARGWDTVLCLAAPAPPDVLEFLHLPFLTLETLPQQHGLGRKAAGTLWTLLRKHQPDAFMYAFDSVLRVFPLMAKAAGVKRIYFNDRSSRLQDTVPARLRADKHLVGNVLSAPISGVISVSEFNRRAGMAKRLTKAPHIVVRNGTEVLDPDREAGRRFREQYGLPEDAVVITQICWMVPIKGVEVMLKAARYLLARFPKVHFLFVGGGEKLEEYRALAAAIPDGERIHFPGIISQPAKAGVLDASDIYCQPSVWQEASGLAVLEAMGKCLPVVASDTGGLPENVLHDLTGLLVPPNRSAPLALALERLVLDGPMRKRLGNAGRQKVLAEHRLQDMIAGYADVLTGQGAQVVPEPFRAQPRSQLVTG